MLGYRKPAPFIGRGAISVCEGRICVEAGEEARDCSDVGTFRGMCRVSRETSINIY